MTTIAPVLLKTKARCIRCRGPVYATTKLDKRLMDRSPKDGQWLCLTCQGTGKK